MYREPIPPTTIITWFVAPSCSNLFASRCRPVLSVSQTATVRLFFLFILLAFDIFGIVTNGNGVVLLYVYLSMLRRQIAASTPLPSNTLIFTLLSPLETVLHNFPNGGRRCVQLLRTYLTSYQAACFSPIDQRDPSSCLPHLIIQFEKYARYVASCPSCKLKKFVWALRHNHDGGWCLPQKKQAGGTMFQSK